jgi:hypothetical protein
LFLQQKIDELAFLQEHRTNKEFFLFIYAETRQTLEVSYLAAMVFQVMIQIISFQTAMMERRK